MNKDPLIHVPLYLDEWQSKLSGLDYFQRGAFITLYIKYVQTGGELKLSGDNTALFRSCGALSIKEQESLIDLYKEVKIFADPRIKKQSELREKRRIYASKGGIAKAKANAIAKGSAKKCAKLELELESEREGELEPDTFNTTISDTDRRSNDPYFDLFQKLS